MGNTGQKLSRPRGNPDYRRPDYWGSIVLRHAYGNGNRLLLKPREKDKGLRTGVQYYSVLVMATRNVLYNLLFSWFWNQAIIEANVFLQNVGDNPRNCTVKNQMTAVWRKIIQKDILPTV